MSQKFAILFVLTGAMLLSSCKSKEIEQLRSENDSLRHELETRHSIVSVMNDVKGLLDSIDASRNVMNTHLGEGTTYENFTNRLSNINDYIKKTQDKIETIEKELKASNNEAVAYLMMVDALKGELEIRAGEVRDLEQRVAEFQKENSNLIRTVSLQKSEMGELQMRINSRQQELKLLEAKVDEMVKNFKVSEAEAYYARGRAVEEAARRTKLAGRKKRETYKEALELYKKAHSLGKLEARKNITELEKRI